MTRSVDTFIPLLQAHQDVIPGVMPDHVAASAAEASETDIRRALSPDEQQQLGKIAKMLSFVEGGSELELSHRIELPQRQNRPEQQP